MRFPRFFILFLIFFTVSLIGVDQARGDEPLPGMSPTINWTRNTIDSAGNVGQFADLAIEPATGLPHISYYDQSSGDLRHAYMTNNPISNSCLLAGWECQSWITPISDGGFTSIDFRNNGNYGILYLSDGFTELHIRGDQGDNQASGNHYINSDYNVTGNSVDLEYDRNGVANVVFAPSYFGNNNFTYGKFIGSGGSCGGDGWDCEVIHATPLAGPYSMSLGMTYYGSPRVAIGTSSSLIYAYRVGNNGSCFLSTWECNTIESGIEVAAVSLHQPSCQIICNAAQIAYRDTTNNQLKLATSVESGGNCGIGNQAGKWQCDVIETTNENYQFGTSLINFNGQTYIAYTDGNDRTNTTLKIAYPSLGGNCGPILNGAGTWQCDTIDTGLRYIGGFPFYHDVGGYPSLEINGSGKLFVAYYDADAGDLLFAEGQLEIIPPSGADQIYLPVVIR